MNKLSKKEFAERMLQSSLLFSDILPIYFEEQRQAFRLAFDQDIVDIIPCFFKDLARHCIKNQEETIPYLIFIKQACEYILDERNRLPDVEYDREEVYSNVEKQLRGWKLD